MVANTGVIDAHLTALLDFLTVGQPKNPVVDGLPRGPEIALRLALSVDLEKSLSEIPRRQNHLSGLESSSVKAGDVSVNPKSR